MAQIIICTNDINITVYEFTTEKYHATKSKAATTLLFHSGYLCRSSSRLGSNGRCNKYRISKVDEKKIGGMGLIYTEFIPSRGIIENSKQFLQMAESDKEESPIAIQIYGNKPDMMAHAAQIVQDMGADIVDINMGCPSKKVCSNSGGSALMKDPTLAIEIVRAVKKVLQVPLTVKIASGFDASNRNAPELSYMCQEEGAEGITIHWRTREDRYGGTRQIDKIVENQAKTADPCHCKWRYYRCTKCDPNGERNRMRWCYGRSGSHEKSLVSLGDRE